MPVSYRAEIRRRSAFGALTLLALVGLVLVLWQRPDPFASPQIVRAQVTDSDGLAPIGADVRVAGVTVGKVTGVARDGALARLTLTLPEPVGEIHRDATAALRPRLMFEGTAYVDLTLGSPASPPLGDGVIPARQTSVYVPLDDALSVLSGHRADRIRTLARTFGGVLAGSTPGQLRDAVAAAPALTANARDVAGAARGEGAASLRAAVTSLGGVSAAVAAQAPALGRSLAETAASTQALDTGSGVPLANALAQLPAATAELSGGARAASAILERARPLLPQLSPGIAALRPTLAAVRPLLRRAVPVLHALTPVLADARRAAAGVRSGAEPALRAVNSLTPTLRIFQDTLLSALESRTALGTPAYLAFLGLFEGGGGASRPFGVDGHGHFMRFGLRFLTGAGLPLPPCTLLDRLSPALGAALATAGGCTP